MPKMKLAVSKRIKREAKKSFAKPKRNTRPFNMEDYNKLPKGEAVAAQ